MVTSWLVWIRSLLCVYTNKMSATECSRGTFSVCARKKLQSYRLNTPVFSWHQRMENCSPISFSNIYRWFRILITTHDTLTLVYTHHIPKSNLWYMCGVQVEQRAILIQRKQCLAKPTMFYWQTASYYNSRWVWYGMAVKVKESWSNRSVMQ